MQDNVLDSWDPLEHKYQALDIFQKDRILRNIASHFLNNGQDSFLHKQDRAACMNLALDIPCYQFLLSTNLHLCRMLLDNGLDNPD